MTILQEAYQYEADMIAWRRDFHQHPEVGFEVVETAQKVRQLLESFGLEVRSDFAKTAVLGILHTGRKGPTVGIRADMDALKMEELTNLPYQSKNPGVCHACGHDAHTAVVLGLARFLSHRKEQLRGTVKFIFQPAEEGPVPGGAKLIMESGVLDDVDVIIAAHAQPLYRSGQIGVRYGQAFASGDFFEVKVTGEGCHGASPHKGQDVILTAAQIIDSLQRIRSRELPPLQSGVVSVCTIQAGVPGANNVLPAQASFGGTFRAHEDSVRDYIARRVETIVKDICHMNGCGCEYRDTYMFPPFSNHPDVVRTIHQSAVEVLGQEQVIEKAEPEMGSEDFAYYTKKLKGALFFFGVRSEEKDCIYGLHHPKFNLDEAALVPALAVFANTVFHLLLDGDGNWV